VALHFLTSWLTILSSAHQHLSHSYIPHIYQCRQLSSSETGPTSSCSVWCGIDCTRCYNASCSSHTDPGYRLGSAFGKTISRNAEALCRRGCFHVYYISIYFYLHTSYSAGILAATYLFGSLKTKRVICFFQIVINPSPWPGRMHFVLFRTLVCYRFPLEAFDLLLPMARYTKSPGRWFFQSDKYKVMSHPP
jgi:hypothetical protein